MKFRHSIRFKLLLVSLTLLGIPWAGYRFIVETEHFLRDAQQQNLQSSAQAIAGVMTAQADVFSKARLPNQTRTQRDIYLSAWDKAPVIDGYADEWAQYAHAFSQYELPDQSLRASFALGQHAKHVYLLLKVADSSHDYGPNGDRIEISLVSNGRLQRLLIAPRAPGWVIAQRRLRSGNQPMPQVRGEWQETATGYTLELRLPARLIDERLAFSIQDGSGGNRLQSARLYPAEQLGNVIKPSPSLASKLAEITPTASRAWVVNHEGLVLARYGHLDASGPLSADQEQLPWVIQQLILAVLPRRADSQFALAPDSIRLAMSPVSEALNGRPSSLRRRVPDSDAIVVSSAVPVRTDEGLVGAVLVEQTTNAILSIQNLALQRLFGVTLVFFVVTSLALLLFASLLTSRIRQLRSALDQAVSHDGRIIGEVDHPRARDEIGELQRSFAAVLQRLSEYNHYLEAMASRLAHELRTPLSVVRTSLDNASHGDLPESQKQYLERAYHGAQRLELILQRLREATRLEQSLQTAERERFDLVALLRHQTEAFRGLWPDIEWELKLPQPSMPVEAVPDLLCQALEKIVGNAVDFHQSDTPIEIELQNQEGDFIIAVRNQGPALPAETDLFQSMVSARTGRSEEPHLGLGLYLVRLIAEFHQGSAFAQNLEPGGVRIGLRLPHPH